jgi:copper(I)-binding protein
MIRRLLELSIILSLLTACPAAALAGPKISVENAWARPAIVGSMRATPKMQGMSEMSGSGTTSAAYFVILNQGSEADTLIGAASGIASKTELHETRFVGDLAEMVPVSQLDVPAGGRIEFKPGGYHVMLEGLKQDLKVGETIKLTLQFAKSGAISLDVPIQMGN